MSNTTENTPRFEVIADYPCAMYKVGDILELFGNSQVLKDPIFYVKGKPTCYYFALSELEKYPHIFRRIQFKAMPENNECDRLAVMFGDISKLSSHIASLYCDLAMNQAFLSSIDDKHPKFDHYDTICRRLLIGIDEAEKGFNKLVARK